MRATVVAAALHKRANDRQVEANTEIMDQEDVQEAFKPETAGDLVRDIIQGYRDPATKLSEAAVAVAPEPEATGVVQSGVPDWKIRRMLRRMACGMTLVECCIEDGEASFPEVMARIEEDPELTRAFDKAMECYCHARVGAMGLIARREPNVARAKLLCDNIRWEVSKLMSQVYGDRVKVQTDKNDPMLKLMEQVADTVGPPRHRSADE